MSRRHSAKRRAEEGDARKGGWGPGSLAEGLLAKAKLSTEAGNNNVGVDGLRALQAQAMAESLFTDMMASAGVSGRSMRLELMNWIPADFRDAYMAMTTKALKDTDGGVEGRSRAQQSTGELGKASGGASGGGGGKKYKRYWTVQDEQMFELKSRIDKRLRSIARDIWGAMEAEEVSRVSGGRAKVSSKEAGSKVVGGEARCSGCGIIMAGGWAYCPRCGKLASRFGVEGRGE